MKKDKKKLTNKLIILGLILLILFIGFFIKNSANNTSKGGWVITDRPVIDFNSLSQEDE